MTLLPNNLRFPHRIGSSVFLFIAVSTLGGCGFYEYRVNLAISFWSQTIGNVSTLFTPMPLALMNRAVPPLMIVKQSVNLVSECMAAPTCADPLVKGLTLQKEI